MVSILRRPSIEEPAARGVSRLPSRRHDSSRQQPWQNTSANSPVGTAAGGPNLPGTGTEAPGDSSQAPEQQASQVETDGRQLAETLRHEGLARARSIIKNAEREAQAVIQTAKEAAEAAERQARARAQAIIEGKPFPPEAGAQPELGSEPSSGGTPPSVGAKVSELPAEGSTLRYRIAMPLSFATMLRLKREIAHLPDVTGVDISPTGKAEAVLSLQAPDATEVFRRLQAIPGLAEART